MYFIASCKEMITTYETINKMLLEVTGRGYLVTPGVHHELYSIISKWLHFPIIKSLSCVAITAPTPL
jgi:hypothetical protein